MQAIVIKGKNKGNIIEIQQWANDWFMARGGKIYKANHLAFTDAGLEEIHANKEKCGSLLKEFKPQARVSVNQFVYTFIRKGHGKKTFSVSI